MTSTSAPDRTWRIVAAGSWFGLAVAIARCGLVYAMDHYGRGLDEAMTRWRVLERVPWVLAWGLATGIVGAWLLGRAAGSQRVGLRSPSAVARIVIVAAAFLGVLSGWPFDDAYHVPGPGSTRGLATLAVLGSAAVVSAVLLAALVRAQRSSAHWIEPRASSAIALGLALTLGFAAHLLARSPGSSMVVEEVARSIALDSASWTVERARPSAPPHAASLTPSLAYEIDGGELPALVLPPPARVSFVVRDDEQGLRLHAAAGCDLGVARAFERQEDAREIVFRISIDGRPVFEHRRTPWRDEDPSSRAWARLGDGDGLDVAAGSRVTLETAFVGAEPSADIAAHAADVGFGDLVLERRVERPRTRASSAEPNIVLVVMDTLRADRTSLHGSARHTTPVLESLAARGTMFESAFATSSWTWPSTASILTGLEPGAHGVISDAESYLADEIDTLPEVLQREGFTTGAFACNPLVSRSRNFDAGFETFESTPDRFVMSEQILPTVLGWIDAHASTRFFLYLHLVDPHELHRSRDADRARFAGPRPADLAEHALHEYAERLLAGEAREPDGTWRPDLVVPESHARWLDGAYDAAVATGDHALGRVLAKLDELSLRENTVVVFTSDHGEEFLEHGHLQHGQSVHTELVHVPLVIAGPGFEAGRRVTEPVSNRHLAPTLARVGGSRLEVADAIDLRGTVESRPIFLATECGWWAGKRDVPSRAIRLDGFSFHWTPSAEDSARLFDLRADPGELVDIAARDVGLAASLRERLLRHEAEQNALRPRALRSGAGTRELLRATGYAGDER